MAVNNSATGIIKYESNASKFDAVF